jgi:hypothetical protein
MRNYLEEAKGLLKKMDYASGVEAKRILEIDFQRLISEARRSKKGKEDLSFILDLQKEAKEKLLKK